jgi:phenylalanine ammonia-lyase
VEQQMTKTTKQSDTLTVSGRSLTLTEVCSLAGHKVGIRIGVDPELHTRMEVSAAIVARAVDQNQTVYGVTTGFGGMAGVAITPALAADSQNNLLYFLAAGAGSAIDRRHVRAAMLLRANVLARGCSGVRPEIVHRLLRFLEADATPVVRELGSIGASGDLVPLATIARAITGQTDFVKVQIGDQSLAGPTALRQLGFKPLSLFPKEGLALVNGTSFSSAVAANCIFEARRLMALTLGVQAMTLRALLAQEEPFEDFVHQLKPHPGQIWTAKIMRRLLTAGRPHTHGKVIDVQDRYSIRCLPQYMGPIVEGIARIGKVVETEMNSVSDNPLVDVRHRKFYQSGNFLGQYIGIAMDDLRRFIGLMAKHLDVQIAMLATPEFNGGLPASLRGNEQLPYNMGLKGLQITGNSIMPMLTYYGNPIVEHFPTHAEQYNQNINGLSWGSANLAWKSVELFHHYLAVALIFSIQALDLRAKSTLGHYDGRGMLGPLAVSLYESTCRAMDHTPQSDRPFLFDDRDQWLEQRQASLYENIRGNGAVMRAIEPILESFDQSNC